MAGDSASLPHNPRLQPTGRRRRETPFEQPPPAAPFLEEVPLSDFELRASDPHLWLSTARQLLFAADELNASLLASMNEYGDDWRERQVGTLRATALLAGLALENGLKALAVFREELVVTEGALRGDGVFTSHNLPVMAKRLRVFEEPHSQDLLRRLSDAVRWAAKYPIPLREPQLPEGASLKLLSTDTQIVQSMLQYLASCVSAV